MTPTQPPSTIAPFEFSSDFSGAAPVRGGLTQAAQARADELRECEAAAYARGYSDGMTIETAGTASKLAQTLDLISSRIEALETELTEHAISAQASAAKLGFAFARKLAGKLVAADPVAPVEEGFQSLLTDLTGVPDIMISVHPDLTDETQIRLTALTTGHLSRCTLHIVADAALTPGDCRIDWVNGGLARDQAAFEACLAELVERSFTHTCTHTKSGETP